MDERVFDTMAKRNLGNLLLVQSGGPTHVINQSLAGVVQEAMRAGRFERVYGADHGMHGVMERKFFDLTAQPKGAWSAIARTPSAYRTRDTPRRRARAGRIGTSHTAAAWRAGRSARATLWGRR